MSRCTRPCKATSETVNCLDDPPFPDVSDDVAKDFVIPLAGSSISAEGCSSMELRSIPCSSWTAALT